jgi:hypothetical protein
MNIDQLKLDINNLRLRYPEMAEDETLNEDMLQGATSIDEVLTTLIRRIDDSGFLLEGLSMRMGELRERKQRFERRIEALRGLILSVLQVADLKKVELAEATLSQRAGQQQIVGEPDPARLPDDLVRIKREANRTAIREALQAGRALEGLSLSNAPPTLAIRTT